MAKRLRKKEILFIEKRLQQLDLEVMEAFVIKEVENVEEHISIYPKRQALWQYIRTRPNPRIWKLLEFLQGTFCQLFGAHYKGKERFGRFLAAWYKEVGTLACDKLSTHNTSTLWSYLKCQYGEEISSVDRSALISAVAAASYTFFQKQVRLQSCTINSKMIYNIIIIIGVSITINLENYSTKCCGYGKNYRGR